MTQIAHPQQDLKELRRVKTLISVVFLATLIATASGAAHWLVDPAEGSSAANAMGITAAISGLVAAVASIASAVYMQTKRLWKYAPTWIRTSVMIFVVAGILLTVGGWINQLLG